MTTVGSRLKSERERLKLSQSAFAAIGGRKKHSQIQYETHDREVPSEYLRALGAVGVDINFVLTGRRAGTPLAPKESAFVTIPRRGEMGPGPDEGQEAIGNIVLPGPQFRRLPVSRTVFWAAEMPNNVMHGVAAQGELVICEGGAHGLYDNQVNLFEIDGDPIIRRVVRASDGTTALRADDPSQPPIHLDELVSKRLRILCRIVGSIQMKPAS